MLLENPLRELLNKQSITRSVFSRCTAKHLVCHTLEARQCALAYIAAKILAIVFTEISARLRVYKFEISRLRLRGLLKAKLSFI